MMLTFLNPVTFKAAEGIEGDELPELLFDKFPCTLQQNSQD
jgi:hypothetical protein